MAERRSGRFLSSGDLATTDFNGQSVLVEITDRLDDARGFQSRIAYTTRPALRGCSEFTWIDADWFEPATIEGSP